MFRQYGDSLGALHNLGFCSYYSLNYEELTNVVDQLSVRQLRVLEATAWTFTEQAHSKNLCRL